MPLQLNIFLLLFGGLQGVLFSLFLLRKKLYQGGYIFLLLYMGVMLLQLTLKVMSKVWLMQNWSDLYSLSQYLPLLYGPLAWLFVKYLLKRGSFDNRDLLHFIPLLFIGFYIPVTYSGAGVDWLDFFVVGPQRRLFLILLSLGIYHWMAWRCWQQHRSALQQYYSDTTKLQLNWLRQFIIVSAIVGLLIATALYLLYMNYPSGHEYRYGFVALTIIIYWFSYTALTKPSIFSIIKGSLKDEQEKPPMIPPLKVYHPQPKYSSSGLGEEQLQLISVSLEKLMENEKLYLQPELTISDLADKLKCSRHHLSQVLNDHLKCSYYDYINQLRVEEAKQLLKAPAYQQQKIASVAYDSGFNSLSTFNDVFKKIAGQTPSQYKKQTEDQSQQQRV
jgi:AraC-like DNA-binding protein